MEYMELRHWIVTRYHQTWDRILKMGKRRPRREKWWKGMVFRFYGKAWEALNGRVPQWGEGDILFEDYFSTAYYVGEKNYRRWMVWQTSKPITGRPLDRLALFCLVILVHYWLVAALVCGSWSDHGLHGRGSFVGFEEISSEKKWLFTHGRRKLETFYSEEAVAAQSAFFARTLKEQLEATAKTPSVRLEVRRSYYKGDVRSESVWPLRNTRAQIYFLSPSSRELVDQLPQTVSVAEYESTKKGGKAVFSFTYGEDTEITGSMALRLWVSALDSDDLDLFVTVHKIDAQGREVFFTGFNGFSKDCVAKGWHRASLRQVDTERSTTFRPRPSLTRREPVPRGDIVLMEIEIHPSSTMFEAGTTLRLAIQGRDPPAVVMAHRATVNHGKHRIHCGGPYDSRLMMPKVLTAEKVPKK